MKKSLKSILSFACLPLISFLLASNSFGQKGSKTKQFSGVLEYKITMRDTNMRRLVPDNKMYVYTNDTIARIENYSQQLGLQVTIRHMELNKSYLLLTVHDTVNFAIKTDHNAADTSKKEPQYTYKKKLFKKKICGLRANRMMVSHPNFKEPIEFLYLKKYKREYLNIFEGLPGLPVKYSIPTADGVVNYELSYIKEYSPRRDLFGIPSDYKKVTFDEFMDYMFPPVTPSPPQN